MISLSKNRNVFYTINENGSICETLIRRSIENVYYVLVESEPKPKLTVAPVENYITPNIRCVIKSFIST